MAIELHHLNTHGMMEQACDVLDGVVRLKERIAELEKLNHDLCERVTENDEIRLHWEEIEQTRAENERMKARIAELEEERRWRKFSEENPPKYTWCLVSGKSQMGNYIVITDFFEEDDWAENPKLDDGALDIEWWMPLPSAPKEDK